MFELLLTFALGFCIGIFFMVGVALHLAHEADLEKENENDETDVWNG